MANSTLKNPRSSEPSLADALRWATRSRPTGILKLNGGDHVQELMVVDGQCYVSRRHPLSRRLDNALQSMGGHPAAPSPQMMETLRELAVNLGRQRFITTFRFRQVQPSADWIGPISSAQLLMEVAILDRSELQLLHQIGGEDACYVAHGERPPTLRLSGDDELVLSRLGTAATIDQLCRELGNDRPRWLRSVVRLAAADLLATALPPEDLRQVDSRPDESRQVDSGLYESRQEDSRPDESRQMDSGLYESRQVDSRPYESRQMDSRPYESRQIDSRPYESRQMDSRPYESRQVDSRPYESRQVDSRPYESRQVDSRPYEPDQEKHTSTTSVAVTPAAPHPATLAIWREQFHLSGDPFSLTPDPSFLFRSDGHAEALAGLKLGIWERRGLMVMIGEVGTGKTTLIYWLLTNLDPEIETAYLSNTLLSFEEILHGALLDFGLQPTSRRRLDLIETLNAFLRRSSEAGKTVVLVIDEAQNLSDEVFEGLRLLLNFETYKSKLLQIILVGQPELASRLRGRGLRQVRDRIAVRCHLNPLTRREAREYIEHRLEMVGGSPSLFTRPAFGVLVRKSKGIPRRINILCHNAMLFAYGRDLTRINWSTARQAFKDMDGSSLRSD